MAIDPAAVGLIHRFADLTVAELESLATATDRHQMDLMKRGVNLPAMFLAARRGLMEWPVYELRMRKAHASAELTLKAANQLDAFTRDTILGNARMAMAYAVVALADPGIDARDRGLLAKPWESTVSPRIR